MFIQESLWDLKEDVGSSVNPLIQSLQGMEIDRRKQQGNSALTAKSIVLTQYLYRIAVYPLPWESHVEMNFEINTAKMLVKSVCISTLSLCFDVPFFINIYYSSNKLKK